MKTLIFIILLLSCSSYSQTTLTSAINPSAGDVDNYKICDTANVSEGNAGLNQNWNFSGISFIDSTSVTFVNSGSTPYGSQFPGSNISSSNDNVNYNYMTTSETNLMINGYGGPDGVIINSDAQMFMQFPFTFNSSFTDNFSSDYTLSGTQIFRTGTTTVTGDAWGTIVLPSGTFTNALRVKYIILTKDSSFIGTPFVTLISTNSYVWFIPGRKFPVFEIVYSTISINGIVFGNNKTVNYNQDPVSGISVISSEIPEDFNLSQNYPNPFNPKTVINYELQVTGNAKLKVFDVLGNEVAEPVNEKQNAGSYSVDFDGSGFASGTYFYSLYIDGRLLATKRMMLLK
ncbi:MAG TPA: T9SS type A sorting domain-containing protein [Ignavibacteria bacterium]|nr:T9SS type A sorting domain-containing protein [Ignavibacteria bacterium]HQY53431.1 T9SS type A sorting domain-containing protein [Ignavibacteria bacterium]